MWLRRLVGITMIVVCVGMNAVVLVGFFAPSKTAQLATVVQQTITPAPVVTISAKPDSVASGSFSALSWTSTGSPTSCTASDNWSGTKTPFGAASTGRITTQGNLKYTLSCKNSGGTGTATVTIAVGPPDAPPPASPPSNSGGSSTSSAATTFCGGATPCYGPNDVSKHASSGNCWGWLGDRVINVSSFDSGFHAARSGVSNIQVGAVCGKDLTPAVNGSVGTSEYPGGHNHQLGAKSSTDSNYAGYYVGYFDASKP